MPTPVEDIKQRLDPFDLAQGLGGVTLNINL